MRNRGTLKFMNINSYFYATTWFYPSKLRSYELLPNVQDHRSCAKYHGGMHIPMFYMVRNLNHDTYSTHCGLMMPRGDIHLAQVVQMQVVACCLTVPSHYLDPCWFIDGVLLHSPKSNFTGTKMSIRKMGSKNTLFKLIPHFPGAHEFQQEVAGQILYC